MEDAQASVTPSVEEELWNIFSYYSLHGNPLQPPLLSSIQLLRLAKDCQLITPTATDKAAAVVLNKPSTGRLTQADVGILFAKVVGKRRAAARSPGRSTPPLQLRPKSLGGGGGAAIGDSNKLTYGEFLNCLLQMSRQLHPDAVPDHGFQQLLMDGVLLLASRRSPTSGAVAQQMAHPEVQKLFNQLEPALKEIFRFYACTSGSSPSPRSHSQGSSFSRSGDEDQYGTSNMSVSGMGSPTTTSRRRCRPLNSMTDSISYDNFLTFASDFGLGGVLISSLELGEMYLRLLVSAARATGGGKCNFSAINSRPLSFTEFCEMLFRCALIVGGRKPPEGSTPGNQEASENDVGEEHAKMLRYLMVYMYGSVQTSAGSHGGPGAIVETGGGDHTASLLRGVQLLNERLITQWKADNFALAPQPAVEEDASVVLSRLLSGTS